MAEQLRPCERWRLAALEPYTNAPRTTQEWLRALELGADAAVRVVLEELQAIAATDGNLDDRLWYERFGALLKEAER